eukprot:Pompholyxophrys_punicea_v1_NODE_426_length_1991_cov_8.607438.p3 type:complete len:109 gc:universal NODE_426_length_1991_cov_8.607438:240-566(+)
MLRSELGFFSRHALLDFLFVIWSLLCVLFSIFQVAFKLDTDRHQARIPFSFVHPFFRSKNTLSNPARFPETDRRVWIKDIMADATHFRPGFPSLQISTLFCVANQRRK